LWLIQYKKIQRGLIDEAISSLRDGHKAALAAWEEFARGAWSSALGQAEIKDASTYLRRAEDRLGRLRVDMKASRSEIARLLAEALAAAQQTKPAGKVTVLSLRRPVSQDQPITLH